MTIRGQHTKYINRVYNSIFKKKNTKQWEVLNLSKEDM